MVGAADSTRLHRRRWLAKEEEAVGTAVGSASAVGAVIYSPHHLGGLVFHLRLCFFLVSYKMKAVNAFQYDASRNGEDIRVSAQ